jgi:hypothetical protein
LVQARSAFAYSEGAPFTAKAGRLVIYLSAQRFSEAGAKREEHLYRLSDGRFGVLPTPPDARFELVEDPEVIALARQVKALSELVAEKGLHLSTVSRLDPFTLIRCPMCGGVDFLTLDLASVWCDRCNVRFQTRSTAGDPGVVVDGYLENYDSVRARYIVPCSLMLTIVLKDFGYSGHPQGACGEYCANVEDGPPGRDESRRDRTPPGLRPGTQPCGLEVYDWSLYGTPEMDDRYCHPDLLIVEEDGQTEDVSLRDRVYDLGSVHSNRLPSLDLLADGELEEREWWYLVDGIPHEPGQSRGWYPIWWKVGAVTEKRSHGGVCVKSWRVVDRTLCPVCLQPAEARDHDYCDWDELGWRPQ